MSLCAPIAVGFLSTHAGADPGRGVGAVGIRPRTVFRQAVHSTPSRERSWFQIRFGSGCEHLDSGTMTIGQRGDQLDGRIGIDRPM
jgi:hypothetical protein